MRKHSDERPYKCETCGFSFKMAVQLADHRVTHTQDGAFECIVCNRNFNRRNLLKKHMAVHSDERPFQCEYCGKSFKFNKNWKVHVLTHTGQNRQICDICGESFVHYNSLRHHMGKHEGGVLRVKGVRRKKTKDISDSSMLFSAIQNLVVTTQVNTPDAMNPENEIHQTMIGIGNNLGNP